MVLVVKGYHIVKGLGFLFFFDVVVVATYYCCGFYIIMAMNIKFSLDDKVIEFELWGSLNQ